jgi:hypothetical protein
MAHLLGVRGREAVEPFRNKLAARVEILLPERKSIKERQSRVEEEFKRKQKMLDDALNAVNRRIKLLDEAYAKITNGQLYTNKRNRPGGRVKQEPVTIDWLTAQLVGGRKILTDLHTAAQKRHSLTAILDKLQEHPELFHGEMAPDVDLPFPWFWELNSSSSRGDDTFNLPKP